MKRSLLREGIKRTGRSNFRECVDCAEVYRNGSIEVGNLNSALSKWKKRHLSIVEERFTERKGQLEEGKDVHNPLRGVPIGVGKKRV